jgi:hypothetical protein
MFALPVMLSGLVFYFNRTTFERIAGGSAKSLFMLPAMMVPGILLITLVFFISSAAAVHDTEIWSGAITGKTRVHDSYVRTYSCNCTTDGKGNQSCSTCYEDHYTVKWSCASTIGDFDIDSADSTSRSVYNRPNPPRYDAVIVGAPASRQMSYVNYVQAVPDTLFKPTSTALKEQFKNMIPSYPDQVYDIYHVDRFVQVGFSFTDAALWNQDISNMLRTLGPKKQVNVIVVVAKTNDPNYMYALRDAWEGVNKNDVVLIIGSEDGQKIEWTDVVSWTRNELFKVELRDSVLALGTIERTAVMSLLEAQIAKNFERRHMAEFQYLSNEIDPPAWLISALVVLLFAGYGGGWYYLNQRSGLL